MVATTSTPEQLPTSVRRWTLSHALIGVLALCFFFGPAIAAGVGVRAKPIENHKLSSFPSPSQRWNVFGNFDSWAIDHLPLRDNAIETNSSIERNIFDEAPNY